MRAPGRRRPGRRRAGVLILAALGALWGAASYTILWGYTSIVVTRDFVDSNIGLIALLPVRVILDAIHLVEVRVAGHPFDFSRNHAWIGILSPAMGALLMVVPFILIRALVRRLVRPSR